MKGIRRIICALLALVFLFGLVPMDASVAAAEAGQLGEAIIEGNRDFKWPVPDYHNISACFFDDRDHYAIDIGTMTTNADIVASYDGEVAEITRNGANDYGYGNAVMLRHTYTTSSGTITLYSRYAHMSEISESLSVGSAVVGGETVLGKTGGSGYGSANYYAVHLDFQILTSNDWLNRQTCSIDPFANNLLELPADLYLGRTSDCCQSYIDAIKALYSGDAHTHSYESAVTPPTCTEDGYTTYTCSCGDSYTDDEVTAPGHSYGTDGVCTVCGDIEALGGACGDNLTWELDANGVLTISGTGNMTDWPADGSPWYGSRLKITSVVIEPGVTGIGACAFRKLSKMTEITIPNGVTIIGERAFYGCENLTEVSIPEGVTVIGDNTFEGCSNLTRIAIPEGVTTIGQWAFCECEKLAEITLPESLEVIGIRAFENCDGLTEITIPEGVTAIESATFIYCNGLTKVTLPDGVISIGKMVFEDCRKLAEINIPDSVTSIGSHAFYFCAALTEITIPENVASIGLRAFGNCQALTDIYFGGTEEDWLALGENRPDLKNVHYSCVDLSNHWYGEYSHEPSCTEIGGTYKTCDCGHRKYIVEIAALGHNYDAEGICTACGDVEVIARGTCGENITWVLDRDKVLIISGTGDMPNFAPSVPWDYYKPTIEAVVIEPGITSICKYAFEGCSNLKNATISESVASIGEDAFLGCSNLKKIVIPENVTSIDEGTFEECSSLEEITIPKSVTSIGKRAFYGCKVTTDVYFGGSTEEWITLGEHRPGAEYVHYSCVSANNHWEGEIHKDASCSEAGGTYAACSCGYEKLIAETAPALGHNWGANHICTVCELLEDGPCGDYVTYTVDKNGVLTVSGNGSMKDCEYLNNGGDIHIIRGWDGIRDEIKKVIVEEGVTSIGWNAFRLLPNLESVEIADSVSYIGDWAFAYNDNLKDISFGSGLQSTGIEVFSGCDSIERVVLPNADVDYGSHFFVHCDGIKEIVFPEKLTAIGGSMFEGCTGLTEVVIPHTITTIGGSAFKGCCNLEVVEIPNSVTKIGPGAFSNCDMLKEVTIPGSVISIGYSAFANCGNLTKVTLSEGLQEMSYGIFELSNKLKEIVVPSTVVKLSHTFRRAYGLESVKFLGHAPNAIGAGLFSDISVKAYYPDNDSTWTQVVMGNYGGNVTWIPEHTYSSTVTPPTCTEDGYTTYTCACGDTYTDDEVTALGHDMSDWVTTEDATCTEDGTKRKDCSRCDHFETEVIPAAHDMGDWYTVTEATPELDGEERRDCSRCDHFESRVTSFVDNMLKLEGEDFLDETTVYINGLPYPVVVSGDERYVELPTEEDCSIVTYDFHVGDPDDIHTQYPVGMKVYIVSDGEITYVQELDNLLQYSGSSIRITGKKGIRMITSLYKNTKSALAGT